MRPSSTSVEPATVQRATLLSVRPRFASALLEGAKSVEIRRRRANIPAGSLILIYATAPVCSIVGSVHVAAVDTGSPDALWQRWGSCTCLEQAEFADYAGKSGLVTALVVCDAARLAVPVGLADLRRRLPRFSVPQSYRFLDEGELLVLVESGIVRRGPDYGSIVRFNARLQPGSRANACTIDETATIVSARSNVA
jgi:predicted transcriptional regulator